MKYRLNIARDVDRDGWDEDGGYILNTPHGYCIDAGDREHVRGFDTLAELKAFVRAGGVIPCTCADCNTNNTNNTNNI
jgi:hypothetical protein